MQAALEKLLKAEPLVFWSDEKADGNSHFENLHLPNIEKWMTEKKTS
jgi:hypothetical protein